MKSLSISALALLGMFSSSSTALTTSQTLTLSSSVVVSASISIPATATATPCAAAGSCHGFGGSGLCNDRCQHCYGASGYYGRGECCGFLGQACCCYYN